MTLKRILFLCATLSLASAIAPGCDESADSTQVVGCEDGNVAVDGVCVATETICGEGTMLVGASCVADGGTTVNCGPGTVEVNGVCEPDGTVNCGPGTMPNTDGECVPTSMIACGTGTMEVNGECVADVGCGAGTIDMNGECIPDPANVLTCGMDTVAVNGECLTVADALRTMSPTVEAENNDLALGGTPTPFDLPVAGSTAILSGNIDLGDFDADGVDDQDIDWFSFSATAGTILEVSLINDGIPDPVFFVTGLDEANAEFFRQSQTGASAEPWRDVVIPMDGNYGIFVAPLSPLLGLFVPPSGGPDFSYLVTVENQGVYSAATASAPAVVAGTMTDPASSATTISPSIQNEPFYVVQGVSDPAIAGIATFIDDNGLIGEIEFVNMPAVLPAPPTGLTVLADWTVAGPAPTSEDITVDVTPLPRQVVPVSALGETAVVGGDRFFATEVPGQVIFEAVVTVDVPGGDLTPQLSILDGNLDVLQTATDDDNDGVITLRRWFENQSDVLMIVTDLDIEDAGTEYGFSVEADIIPVQLIGDLVDGATETLMATSSTPISSIANDNHWVGFGVTPGMNAGLVDVTATPADAGATIGFDIFRGDDVRIGPFAVANAAGEAASTGMVLTQDDRIFLNVVALDGTTSFDIDVSWLSVAFSQYASMPAAPIDMAGDGSDVLVIDTVSVAGCATVAYVSLDVDITHEYRGDLELILTNPTGTMVMVQASSFDAAPDIIGNYPDTLAPTESLDGFLSEGGTGDWTLQVTDTFEFFDGGTLNSWALNLVCL